MDQPKKVKKAKRVADDELACVWIMSHPWVVYTGKRSPAGHRYATCSCCTEDNPGESKFGCEGEGAVVTDKSDLVCHEASRSHVTAMEHKAAKAGAPGGIRHGMAAAAAAATTAVKTLFPTLLLVALWLITEHVAMVKFPSLLALLVMTGNEAIKHKYNTTRYFWSCLYALSEVLLLAQRSALLNSPFYNILIDSSTDISLRTIC